MANHGGMSIACGDALLRERAGARQERQHASRAVAELHAQHRPRRGALARIVGQAHGLALDDAPPASARLAGRAERPALPREPCPRDRRPPTSPDGEEHDRERDAGTTSTATIDDGRGLATNPCRRDGSPGSGRAGSGGNMIISSPRPRSSRALRSANGEWVARSPTASATATTSPLRLELALVLVVVAVQAQELPVAAVRRVVVVVVVAVVDRQLAQVRARERARAAPAYPRIDLERLLAVALPPLERRAPRAGDDAVEAAGVGRLHAAGRAPRRRAPPRRRRGTSFVSSAPPMSRMRFCAANSRALSVRSPATT